MASQAPGAPLPPSTSFGPRPYAGASSAWAFLEMSRFLEPLEEFVPVHTGGGAASLEQPPADVSELDISVLGLNESLPVKRGAVDSGHFFAVTLVGADVAPGHRVQVSPAGDCGAAPCDRDRVTMRKPQNIRIIGSRK